MIATAFDTRELESRGLSAATLAHFGVVRRTDPEAGVFWEYPTQFPGGDPGPLRRKFRNPEISAAFNRPTLRYAWASGSEPDKPATYNLCAVLGALERDSATPVWLVGGEVEVWLFAQESIPAFCIIPRTQDPDDCGDGMEEAFTRLGYLRASNVHVFPDSNDEDRRLLGHIARAGRLHRVPLAFHKWPYPQHDERYDLADFHDDCVRVDLPLETAILDMPNQDAKILLQWEKSALDWEEERCQKRREADARAAAELALGGEAPDEEEGGETFNEFFSRVAGTASPGKRSSEDQMLGLMKVFSGEFDYNAQLWKTVNDEHFLSLMWRGRREVFNINDSKFSYFLDQMARDELGFLMTKQAIDTAQFRFKSMASQKGKVAEICPRINGNAQRIYIDLHNRQNEVVEIGEGIGENGGYGWRVTTQYHGIFRRVDGQERLARPVRNADNAAVWKEFKELFHPGSEENWVLMIGWLFGCLRPPTAPYAGLIVAGEQDSGKTLKTRMLRALIDPNTRELGSKPRDERDLAISAQNQFIVGFENMSGMDKNLSDAFCRIATGSSFSTRKLRTDDEEKVFKVIRPLLFNGIDSQMGGDDFKRRMIHVDLPRLPSKEKLDELEIAARFNRLRPQVLGALCDAAALALENFPKMPNVDVGRGLVHFDRWVRAGEAALPWDRGRWHRSYLANMREVAALASEAPFPHAVQLLLDEHEEQNGKGVPLELKTGDLCLKLNRIGALQLIDSEEYARMDETARRITLERALVDLKREKSFPTDPKWCGRALKREASMLLQVGVDARYKKDRSAWQLRRMANEELEEVTVGPEEEQPIDADIFDDQD